ncbi:hypothetical protein V8F06_013778 [Rhypophila decipiens]
MAKTTTTSPTPSEALPFRQVVIIGAGLAGLNVACRLLTKLNFDDFVIYDRYPGLGGTWYENDYPGCAVDIPGCTYQLSYAPEPNFSRIFPVRGEMKAYIDRVASRFDIPRHVVYNRNWIDATWDDDTKTWTVELQCTKTGQTYTQVCKVLVGAIGHQVDPKELQVPGLADFKGQIIYASKYPAGLDLKGKDVVVLGTGSTATQIVPNILKHVESCTQIQREPHWIVNRPNPYLPSWLRTTLTNFPLLFRLLQHLVFAITELFYPILGRSLARLATKHMKQASVPEKYHSILTPSYTPGCKRIVFSVDYLQCLQNPKFSLVQDTVSRLDPTSVITSSGASFPAQVIIVCYGFKAHTFFYPLHGRDGITPQQHWAQAGGPSGYKGTSMHGFPNFFMVRGPNVSSGHQSLIWFIEASTELILNVAKPLVLGQVDCVEVDKEAERKWVVETQKACQKGFWGRDCHTFYVTESGWNHTVYPWTPYKLWFHRFVSKGHWIVTKFGHLKNDQDCKS